MNLNDEIELLSQSLISDYSDTDKQLLFELEYDKYKQKKDKI